jgi:exodeoxyribonuclease V alpha subunit
MTSFRKNTALLKQLDSLLLEYEAVKQSAGLVSYEPVLQKTTIVRDYIKKYNLPVRSLYAIVSFLQNKWTIHKDASMLIPFLLSNIKVQPEVFITQEDVLLPFDMIERIVETESLKTHVNVVCECWVRNYFLSTRKAFFETTRRVKEDLMQYINKNQNGDTDAYQHIIKNVLVAYDKTYSTLQCFLNLEDSTSKMIKSIISEPWSNGEDIEPEEDIAIFMDAYEKEKGIRINIEQRQAIYKSIQNRSHIICGFPGTGKSTIFDVIKAYFYEKYGEKNYTISCMAPTGLAIKNLMNKCKINHPDICGTIHRMLYSVYHIILSNDMINDNDLKKMMDGGEHQDKNRIRRHNKITKFKALMPKMMVIDEFSMVDMLLLNQILQFCKEFNCRLVILGDENQLPPVGPGNAMYTMTRSKKLKAHVTHLNQIMRQEHPLLVENIKRVKDGEYLLKDHFDNERMIMLNYNDFIDSKSNGLLSNEALCTFMKKFSINLHTAQFLTPENHKNCGSVALNEFLQKHYHKEYCNNGVGSTHIPYTKFKVNDRVVRTQNCPVEDKGIFANGDTATVVRLGIDKDDPKNKTVIVRYDQSQEEQEISTQELTEEFNLRYCMTIHKSQGGEYDDVILFMGTPHENSSWTQRNGKKLLYTAISRAKSRCFIIAKNNLLSITQSMEEFHPFTTFLK